MNNANDNKYEIRVASIREINRLRKLHRCETVETRISKSADIRSLAIYTKVSALIAGISLRVSLRASLRDPRSPKALISRRVPPARGS